MYKFVENKDKTWSGIGLTEEAGKYQGVVYEYGKVAIVENEEKTEASLQFEWDMLDSNGLPKESIKDDFFELAGKICRGLHPIDLGLIPSKFGGGEYDRRPVYQLRLRLKRLYRAVPCHVLGPLRTIAHIAWYNLCRSLFLHDK